MRPTLLVLVCLSPCALLACEDLPDARAEDLVRQYNRALATAFRTADPSPLKGVASEREVAKVTHLIDVKRETNMTLDSTLVDFGMQGVDRTGKKVQVRSTERWRYVNRRIGSGEPVSATTDERYMMRYDLLRDGEKWKVDETAFLSKPGNDSKPKETP